MKFTVCTCTMQPFNCLVNTMIVWEIRGLLSVIGIKNLIKNLFCQTSENVGSYMRGFTVFVLRSPNFRVATIKR